MASYRSHIGSFALAQRPRPKTTTFLVDIESDGRPVRRRREHGKSKAGCKNCKARKVKASTEPVYPRALQSSTCPSAGADGSCSAMRSIPAETVRRGTRTAVLLPLRRKSPGWALKPIHQDLWLAVRDSPSPWPPVFFVP